MRGADTRKRLEQVRDRFSYLSVSIEDDRTCFVI
jgi:hypothetical protein